MKKIFWYFKKSADIFPSCIVVLWGGDIFPSCACSVAEAHSGKYLPPLLTSHAGKYLRSFLLIIFFFLSPPLFAAATKWSLDADRGKGGIEFLAIGKPKALKIHGKGEKPNGKIVIENGKIFGHLTFDLSTLDTGISLRNRHLKEKYLEIEKFPKAELSLTKIDHLEKIVLSEEIDLDSLPFEGILSLHGVKKPVSGNTRVEKKKQTIDLKAAFDIKIKDFDIAVPSYAGITVADNIKIEVELYAPLLRQGAAEHVIPSPKGEESVR